MIGQFCYSEESFSVVAESAFGDPWLVLRALGVEAF